MSDPIIPPSVGGSSDVTTIGQGGGVAPAASSVATIPVPVPAAAGGVETLSPVPVEPVTVNPGDPVVLYTPQVLTEAQKGLARRNIGAAAEGLLDVKDFGAVGDGVTDDAAAIQAALTALEGSATHDGLFFPRGKYRLLARQSHGVSVLDYTSSHAHFLFGTTEGMAGRDIRIVGEAGSVLFNDTAPNRCHTFFVWGRFRSLIFEGLKFEKSETPQTISTGTEPNHHTAVMVQNVDRREIERLAFKDCEFYNTHGAVRIYGGKGSNRIGKLKVFDFADSQVLNPWGGNRAAGVPLGNGQQFYMTGWVGTANYRGSLFVGAGDDQTGQAGSPVITAKDGCIFGGPLRLNFVGNVVRNFAIESVFLVNNANDLGSYSGFTVPAADGVTTVDVTIGTAGDTTYVAGQVLVFYKDEATHVRLEVVSWAPTGAEGAGVLTCRNHGAGGAAPATVIAAGQVYLFGPSKSSGVIVGNNVSWDDPVGITPVGSQGIVVAERSTVTGNTVNGMVIGIQVYKEVHTPGYEQARGTVINGNTVTMAETATYSTYRSYGTKIEQGNVDVCNNTFIAPRSRKVTAVGLNSDNNRVRGNMAMTLIKEVNGYSSPNRSVGFAVDNGLAGNIFEDNKTIGWDVGCGPVNASQPGGARVISYHSVDDELDVDSYIGVLRPKVGRVGSIDSGGMLSFKTGESLVARKPLQSSKTSDTTLADDADLQLGVRANSVYYVRAIVGFDGGAGGIKFKLNLPAGATFRGSYSRASNNGWNASGRKLLESTVPGTNSNGGESAIFIEGILKTVGTAGTAAIQWAQNSSNAAPTNVTTGSGMTATMQG